MGGGIDFESGGAITGSMTADAGAYLQFDGGTFDLDAASTLTGAGTAYFTGATVDDAGDYTVTGTTVLSNGTLDFSGGQSVSIPDLTMSGGTLTGFTSLTVTGPTDWTGGAITGGGTITTEAALTLGDPGQGDQEVLDGAALDNQAAATLADSYSGYGLYLYDGAVFDNEAGARFTFLTNAQISGDGSGAIFRNDGVLVQSADANGSSGVSAIFDQSATGTTEVMGGGIDFVSGGAITNSMTADAGAYLQFGGGTFDLDGASTLTGAGTADFTGATVDDAGAYTITGPTVLTNGKLDFAGGQVGLDTRPDDERRDVDRLHLVDRDRPDRLDGWGDHRGRDDHDRGRRSTLGDPGQGDQEVLDGAALDNQAAATLADSYSGYGLYLYDGADLRQRGRRPLHLPHQRADLHRRQQLGLPERWDTHAVGGRHGHVGHLRRIRPDRHRQRRGPGGHAPVQRHQHLCGDRPGRERRVAGDDAARRRTSRAARSPEGPGSSSAAARCRWMRTSPPTPPRSCSTAPGRASTTWRRWPRSPRAEAWKSSMAARSPPPGTWTTPGPSTSRPAR